MVHGLFEVLKPQLPIVVLDCDHIATPRPPPPPPISNTNFSEWAIVGKVHLPSHSNVHLQIHLD